MDGTEGERARKSRKLAKTVEIWSGLPVRMWDERQTTCAAADLLDESGTFGAKRKSILDSVSATVILDDYIQWRKEHPGRSERPAAPVAKFLCEVRTVCCKVRRKSSFSGLFSQFS